jgi:hypothetical protein
MQAQILVPIKRHERVEELVPYLELLAPAGSTVVFLIPIAANLFPWWSEALIAPASELKSAMTLSVLAAKASRERQLQAAMEQIAAARRALERKGVVVQIDCFLGGMEKELARLSETATHTLVLQSKSHRLLIKSLGCFSFLRRCIAPSRGAAMTLSPPRQSA